MSGKVDEGSPAKTAAKWKEAASRCYDYFIFQRATHPEWTLERPGSSTDDPLTLDKDRGGNPDLAIFNSCQPLMSGPNSRAVISGLSAEGRGFAPVLQYQRPDLDEADYNPQEHLQRSFATRFPGRPIPAFRNIFPCVKNMGDAGTIVQTDWEVFNNTLIINYAVSAFVELTVLRKPWGPQYFIPMTNEPYASPGLHKLGFCPNVEKINIPTHPFAPRNDIRSLEHPEGIFNPSAPAVSKAKHEVDLLLSGPLYLFNRSVTNKYFTDREYSNMTSFPTPEDRMFHTWSIGYSDYNKTIFNPANKLSSIIPDSLLPGLPGKGNDDDPDNNGGGLGGLGGGLGEITGEIEDLAEKAQKIQEIGGKVQGVASKVQELIGTAQNIGEKVQSITGKIQSITGKVQDVTQKVQSVTGKVGDIKAKIEAIKAKIKSLPAGIGNIPADLNNIPGQILTDAQKQITSNIDSQVSSIKNDVTTGINDQITNIKDSVVSNIKDTLTDVDVKVTSFDGSITSKLISSVKDKLVSGIKSAITDLPGKIVSGIQDKIADIPNSITSAIQGKLTGIPAEISGIQGQISGLEGIVSGISPSQMTAEAQAIVAEIQALVADVKNQITAVPQEIAEVKQGVTEIKESVGEIKGTAGEIQGSINKLQEGLSTIQENIAELQEEVDEEDSSTLSDIAGALDELINREKYPEVMCAVVPVDILEPRRKAFNSCIMERINFNFVTWRRRNFLSYYYSTQNSDGGLNLSLPVNPIVGDVFSGVLLAIPAAITAGISFLAGKDGTLKPWKKPCVTRFYESDTFEECPVAMSIQQCCRIIVKDVVPMNYIKIRTCEGLRQKRDLAFGHSHIFDSSQRTIDTFKDDWAIANAKTPEEKLKAEQIVLIKQLDTPAPIVSQGGKGMKTPTSQGEYNTVYDINQKLTLIGCDDTEPETYSFGHYFDLSPWADTKSTTSPAFAINKLYIPINEELKGLRIVSDGTIAEARKLANAATNIDGASAADAWDVYQSVKNPIVAKIKEAEDLTNKLLIEEQKALKEFETTQRKLKSLLSPHEVLALAAGAISTDVPVALGKELIAAGNDWGTKKLAAKAAAVALEGINYVEGQTLAKAEGKAKDLITKWLEIREKYIVEKGKNIADDIVTKGIGVIKKTQGSPIKSAIDKSIAALTSNPITELSTVKLMKEGGAHMPYMRRWDTGTSAGNPLHGGSFINTLGSYDVVIGVGHEERTFGDATNTTTDVSTVQDAGAIAAALKRLEAARAAFAKIQNDYKSVCPAYIGVWNFDTYSINYNRYTYTRKYANGKCGGIYDGAQNPCYPSQMPYPNLSYPFVSKTNCMNNSGAHWVACNVGGNTDCLLAELNRAQAEMDAAEAAFQKARRQSITTITTTSDKADIPSGESMIKTAHMGRVDGWDGLKGHQMLSIYRKNMSCIGRHEKLFKGEGAENFVLAKAGTGYRSKDGKDFPWPLAWRGYVTDPNNEFIKDGPSKLTGLDNAKMGDIIIYTLSGMKRIAFVDYVNNTDPKFVKIESWDQGKFPTSSGASLTLGTSVDRTIYKSAVPEMEKIKALPAGKKALIGNQPSCEDPSYTSCILGGSLDIIGKDGAVVENIPNSTWDNVIIYRPSLDTAERQCPMINTKKDADGNLKVPLSEMPTDSISFCINAGYDPPVIRNVGYDGPGAGNISDTTLCGPEWGSCKFYSDKATLAEKKKESLCFPGREVCENPNSVPLPPPPPGSEDQCTAEEYDEALKAYQADLEKLHKAQQEIDKKIEAANKAVEDAENALRDYRNRITAELAEKRLGNCTKDIDSRLDELKRQLTEAQNKLAEAQAAGNTAEIDKWTTRIENINAEMNRLSNILCLTGSLKAAVEDLKAKNAALIAARNNLNKYIEEHPFDDNTPRAEIDKIADNIAKLRNAYDKAAKEAEAAQARVAQLMKTMDCLCPPSAADKADQDAANAKIKELEAALAKAIKDAEALEQDLEKVRNMKVPKMSCPYVPLDEQ
ncbi:MAG: hypothetical protein ABL867_06095 [Rickettsiales bacterium]